MGNEDFSEEVSDHETEVGLQEQAFPEGAVAAVAPLMVEEPEVPYNPESLSPALSNVGELFLTNFDCSDLQLLKDWMEHSRFMRGGIGYLVVEPLITQMFKGFLQFFYGSEWEDTFLRGGEMLLA